MPDRLTLACALCASLVALALIGGLAWQAAQSGALPTLPHPYSEIAR